MTYPTKITTCCYCGTRAVLVLKGKVSHELGCSTCGAPIHMMKRVAVEEGKHPNRLEKPKKTKVAVSHQPAKKSFKKPKRQKKRRKSAFIWFLDEAKDAIEDIFD